MPTGSSPVAGQDPERSDHNNNWLQEDDWDSKGFSWYKRSHSFYNRGGSDGYLYVVNGKSGIKGGDGGNGGAAGLENSSVIAKYLCYKKNLFRYWRKSGASQIIWIAKTTEHLYIYK